jgi:hypothetical protein
VPPKRQQHCPFQYSEEIEEETNISKEPPKDVEIIMSADIILDMTGISISLKSSTFWGITPCSLLRINRSFGGTCLRFQSKIKPNADPP